MLGQDVPLGPPIILTILITLIKYYERGKRLVRMYSVLPGYVIMDALNESLCSPD